MLCDLRDDPTVHQHLPSKGESPLLLLGFSDHPAASALFNRAANTSGLLQQIANHLIVSQEPEIDHQIVDVIYNPVWESSLPHHPNQQKCKPKNDRQLWMQNVMENFGMSIHTIWTRYAGEQTVSNTFSMNVGTPIGSYTTTETFWHPTWFSYPAPTCH